MHKKENSDEYFYTATVEKKGIPTGKELLNLDPNNYYELCEKSFDEIKELPLKPEEIKNLILKQ